MIGADPDRLDDLARELSGAADRLAATHTALRGRLHTAPWSGTDAQAFRHDWDTAHHRAIDGACRRLRDASVDLFRQADEQRRASAAPGAGTPIGPVGDSAPLTAGEGDVSRNPGSEDRPDELGSGRPGWPPIPGTTPLDGT